MSEKRPLDNDSTFLYDNTEDKGYIQTTTDVSGVIEHNKRAQNDGTGGWSPDRSFRKVAEIPLALIDHWQTVYGVNVLKKENHELLRRLLNDSSLRFLRTADWRF